MPRQTTPDQPVLHCWSLLGLVSAMLIPGFMPQLPAQAAQPVNVVKRRVGGIEFYQTTIDLTDSKTFVTIGLANNAVQANSARVSHGAEKFPRMVRRAKAAVVSNGTFFSEDAQRRVMGNMVAGGKFLKYSPWENYGTTLGIRAGKQPEMVTARIDGKPNWKEHWFSLTGGPRLLKQGKVSLSPRREGFTDPHVMGVARRVAIGYPRSGKKLVLATFLAPLSLEQEAKLMRAIGCYEAMNLDGGSSLALSKSGRILVPTTRGLTNAIVVYDAKHPAPRKLRESWVAFEKQAQKVYALKSPDGISLQAQLPEPIQWGFAGVALTATLTAGL